MLRFATVLVAASLLAGCPGPDDPPIEPTYENVENLVRESCAFTVSCHGGLGRGKARLNFAALLDDGVPITTELNGVTACEYNRMPRIDPGHPENSWLWIKISGAHTGARLDFTPASDWEHGVAMNSDGTLRASTCPLTVEGQLSFGEIMPMGGQLSPNRLRAFREWIEMGAPGPEGYDAGVPQDAGLDATTDATVDATTDATVDATTDASVDAPIDATMDATMSVDAATDASSPAEDALMSIDATTSDASSDMSSTVDSG